MTKFMLHEVNNNTVLYNHTLKSNTIALAKLESRRLQSRDNSKLKLLAYSTRIVLSVRINNRWYDR